MYAEDGANDACEVALGSVLVSLLDPAPGQEVAFHRWYERDHFYAGVMAGPWFFAGRRFVATRELKDMRLCAPEAAPVLEDLRRGSYLTLYWILAGHHREAEHWSVEQVQRLIARGRMLAGRRPVHAGFYRHRWSAFRDADGVPAELALDHPYAGVALAMVERAPEVAVEVERWLREEQLPRTLRGSPAALCLGLEPMPLPDGVPAYIPRSQGLERRCLLLFFLEADPRACWKELVEPLRPALASTGLARLALAAPFIPTIPGADRYADELG
jgi:hypothetical protein